MKPLVSDDERAWQLVAGIIHHLERAGESPYDIDGSWRELLGTFRNATPDVLKHIVQCPVNSRAALLSTLVASYPEHLAEVASYSLDHSKDLTSAFGRVQDLRHFAIVLLEACGGAESITRLLPLVSDQDLGRSAVTAIQTIRARTNM